MHLMVRSHVRRRRKIKLVNKSVNKCTCIQCGIKNFRQNKKKSIRLKDQYIKYKKNHRHTFFMLIIKNTNFWGSHSTQEHINFTTNSHRDTNWSVKHSQSAIKNIKTKLNFIKQSKITQNLIF